MAEKEEGEEKIPMDGITEGKAHVVGMAGNVVFYNPPQVMNRDLSVIAIQEFQKILEEERLEKDTKKAENAELRFQNALEKAQKEGRDPPEKFPPASPTAGKGLRVLDALSASGLRAFRYSLEIDGIESVMANDLLPEAVEAIKKNIEINKIEEGKVNPNLCVLIEFRKTQTT